MHSIKYEKKQYNLLNISKSYVSSPNSLILPVHTFIAVKFVAFAQFRPNLVQFSVAYKPVEHLGPQLSQSLLVI